MTRRQWPAYCGPGWIAFYASGVTVGIVELELWGAFAVAVLIAVGVLMIAGVAHAMGARDDNNFRDGE